MGTKVLVAALAINVSFIMGSASAEEYCGLEVAPEDRCSDYEAKKYVYSSVLDKRYVEALGYTVDSKGKLDRGIKSPYVKGIKIRYLQDMDIEHIVPRSEAHDSGLCSRPDEWRTFASDMDNITIASEHVNRTLKSDHEPQEWMPDKRQKWYLTTWLDVKKKYGLTIDTVERDAIKAHLADLGVEGCPEAKDKEAE